MASYLQDNFLRGCRVALQKISEGFYMICCQKEDKLRQMVFPPPSKTYKGNLLKWKMKGTKSKIAGAEGGP